MRLTGGNPQASEMHQAVTDLKTLTERHAAAVEKLLDELRITYPIVTG